MTTEGSRPSSAMRATVIRLTLRESVAEALAARAIQQRAQPADEWTLPSR